MKQIIIGDAIIEMRDVSIDVFRRRPNGIEDFLVCWLYKPNRTDMTILRNAIRADFDEATTDTIMAAIAMWEAA
jgi:hypothetical protein